MKQVKSKKTVKHPKGDVKKGSIYNWNEDTNFYEYKQNGIVISTVNEAGVNYFIDMFERI